MDPLRKAKISWHCRRGMLELDLLLEKILEHQLDQMSDTQVTQFERLLDCTDPEIYAWLMGHTPAPEGELRDIVTFIESGH
ncbi:MAG: succinate dehydrogenase assembly factor 2 [Legionellaceae bacterium]|nr:succinate dehydrogenase assembly factor 2 [Legionellaceae bacterium]